MRLSRRTAVGAAILASSASLALVLSGCAAGGGDTTTDDTTPVTLTITTFGTMGIDANYDAYMKLHPNVTIEATNLADGGSARDDAYAKIAAGTGLSDIVAIEEGWLSSIRDVSDSFEDLNDYGFADAAKSAGFLDWKVAQGTDASGRVFGAPLDIGPEGLCYRGDLFAAAGLPSDRDAVRDLFGGDNATWAKYYEVGAQYQAATGKPFFHNPSFQWNAFVNQLDEGYYKKDGTTLNIEDNQAMKDQMNLIVANAKEGAGLPAWGVGDQAKKDLFATYICPSWMLGVVSGYYDAGTTDSGWDFADVMPGGSANWGGSFLGVAASSEHKKAAAALALWLAAPEQNKVSFEAAGPFPSSTEGQKLVADSTNPFFNNAPVGAIFGSRSQGVVAQVKGSEDSVIQDNVFGAVLDKISQGDIKTGDAAWAAAMDLLHQLVPESN
ncbi:extracellular solute-binding protein [soil metagenome]